MTDNYDESIEIGLPSRFVSQEEEGFEELLQDNGPVGLGTIEEENVFTRGGDDDAPSDPPTTFLPRISKTKCLKGGIAFTALLALLAVVITTTTMSNSEQSIGSPYPMMPKSSKAASLSSPLPKVVKAKSAKMVKCNESMSMSVFSPIAKSVKAMDSLSVSMIIDFPHPFAKSGVKVTKTTKCIPATN